MLADLGDGGYLERFRDAESDVVLHLYDVPGERAGVYVQMP